MKPHKGNSSKIDIEFLEAPQHLIEASREKRRLVQWVEDQILKAFVFNGCGKKSRL